MILGFAATMAVVTGLIHLYLWKRMVRDTLRPGRGRRIGAVVTVLLAALIPLTMVGVRQGYLPWLAWPGYLWLAGMFYLLVVLLALELPMLAARWWLRRRATQPGSAPATDGTTAVSTASLATASSRLAESSGPGSSGAADDAAAGNPVGGPPVTGSSAPAAANIGSAGEPPNPDRRLLLARGAAIFAGLTTTGIVGYGVKSALGPPQLDRVQIPLARLPRAMDGTRIAVVSDIHLGPLVRPDHARRIVDLINSVDADIVTIVGDLVDGTVEELGVSAAPLRDIRAKQGAFFVTGNHEYYSGHEPWIAELQRLGIRVLRNERQELQLKGGALDLAGVNDIGGEQFGDGPDFARTFAGRDPAKPVVLMAHQPVQAENAAAYGVDLQVSGHTHGGQMVPFNYLVKLQQPVVSGFGTVDGVPVYVTNGAGFWGPPVRVGAPPQVSVLDLRAP
jgi:hypothetical protein